MNWWRYFWTRDIAQSRRPRFCRGFNFFFFAVHCKFLKSKTEEQRTQEYRKRFSFRITNWRRRRGRIANRWKRSQVWDGRIPLPRTPLLYSRFPLLFVSACHAGNSNRRTGHPGYKKMKIQVVFVLIDHKVKNNIYAHIPAVLFCRLFSFISTVAQRGAISQQRRMLRSCY